MPNSYMFLKKTLNSVGRIILLPGQLYLVENLLNREQNNKKGEDSRTMRKFLLGPGVTWGRDEENVRKPRRKEGMEQIASKNRAKNIQPVLGKGSCFDSGS